MNNQSFSDDVLNNTAQELYYFKEHPKEYKIFSNLNDLKEDLLKDD